MCHHTRKVAFLAESQCYLQRQFSPKPGTPRRKQGYILKLELNN
jgi:hypothetical protein